MRAVILESRDGDLSIPPIIGLNFFFKLFHQHHQFNSKPKEREEIIDVYSSVLLSPGGHLFFLAANIIVF